MLKKRIVSEKAFLETYGDLWSEYRAVTSAKNRSATALAKATGVSESAVRRWLRGAKAPKPKSIQGLEQVRGFLPLTPEHPRFRELNLLASFALFSGSIDRSYNIALREEPRLLRYAGKRMLGPLGIKSYSRQQGRALQANQGTAAMGRVLSVLGVPVAEAKRSMERPELPAYIRKMVSALEENKLRGRQETKAKQILSDFSRVLLATRMRKRRGSRHVDLPNLKTREAAERLGTQVQRMLAQVVDRRTRLKVHKVKNRFQARVHFEPREGGPSRNKEKPRR